MNKELNIEWRHLVVDSNTCERCDSTGKNIATAISILKEKYKDSGIKIKYIETTLSADRIAESNVILFNGTPIEQILEKFKVSENECQSCCSMIGEETCCRTLVDQDGTVHEEISVELIVKAASSSVNVMKKSEPSLKKYLQFGAIAFIIWSVLYNFLPQISKFITYTILPINEGTHLGASLEFFFLDVPKVLMLLTLVVFFVGIVRSFFTPERTRKILAGKKEFVGNILAALLGIVTPFCSCSAVPLFIGFVSAGIPLGVTFSFLISAPMVNEIALVLLYGMFGWKVAAIYLSTGLLIAILAGFVIGRLKMEKYIEGWVREAKPPVTSESTKEDQWVERIEYGIQAVKDIVGKVWIYVILGIAVGAGIHGYVPEAFMASIMGKDAWWSVPLAVMIGVPLYSNAAGIIPIVHALLEKGAALGTVLAFMMSVIGLSLPELIILRKVLKIQLIAAFVGVVAVGILLTGYLFNMIF